MPRKTPDSNVLVPIFFIEFHFDSRLLYYTKYTVGRIHIETKCRGNHLEAVKERLENLGNSLKPRRWRLEQENQRVEHQLTSSLNS